jgi:DNA-binding HxlR family transcriptional regulator
MADLASASDSQMIAGWLTSDEVSYDGAVPAALQMAGSLNPRSGWEADHCSIAETLEVLSTKSAFLILREAFYGTTRFDDFAQRVGLSPAVTAARLRELVLWGLLEREEYREPGQRTRNGYRLTPRGADLFPALAALMQWGDRWLGEDGGRVMLRHRGCGRQVDVHLLCRAGHDLRVEDLELTPTGKAGTSGRRPRRG